MSRSHIKFAAITLFVLALMLLPYVIAFAGWASGGSD
jgi:hypothetical protein